MDNKRTLTLQASGNDFTVKTESHPNKMKFTATVMYLDQYSDGIPGGTIWDKIMLEKSECEKALESMNLMGINCMWDDSYWTEHVFTGHDIRNKIGVVEKTYIEGNELKIDGIIYKQDFYDIARFIKNTMDSMGFSIEASFDDYEETNDGVIIRNVEFTGVSMLFKNCAAYSDTYIETLSASKKDKEIMTQEERNTFMEEVTNSIMAKINEVKEQEKQASELETLKAQIETLQASNKALEEENNKLKASAESTEESTEESEKEVNAESTVEETKEVKASEVVTSDLKTKAKFVEASNVEYKSYGAMINAFIKSING